MGFAEDMTNMGEHFISSFDNRMKDVKKAFAAAHALRRDSQSFLGRVHNEHKEMSRKLNQDLGKFNNRLQEETCETLQSFHRDRRSKAKRQNQVLKSFTGELRQFAKNMHDQGNKDHRERRKFCSDISNHVKNLNNQTHNFLKRCDREQCALHDEFERGSKNFHRAMKEMEQHKKTVHFTGYTEPRPKPKARVAKPQRASPAGKKTRKRGSAKKMRRVTK